MAASKNVNERNGKNDKHGVLMRHREIKNGVVQTDKKREKDSTTREWTEVRGTRSDEMALENSWHLQSTKPPGT